MTCEEEKDRGVNSDKILPLLTLYSDYYILVLLFNTYHSTSWKPNGFQIILVLVQIGILIYTRIYN